MSCLNIFWPQNAKVKIYENPFCKMLKEKLEPRQKKPLRRFHFSGNISTPSSTKLNNGTNLSDVADSIILSFFYFIQERQDTPGKKNNSYSPLLMITGTSDIPSTLSKQILSGRQQPISLLVAENSLHWGSSFERQSVYRGSNKWLQNGKDQL